MEHEREGQGQGEGHGHGQQRTLLESLHAQAIQYYDFMPNGVACQQLIQTIQNNDCRDIVSAAVDGDPLANAFVNAGIFDHVDLMDVLLNNGINVNIKNEDGCCALTAACANVEAIKLLLRADADVDLQDNVGITALMAMAENSFDQSTKFAELLLEKNVNVDLQDNNGRTALMIASKSGHQLMTQFLLNHGANVELRNNAGQTALDVAETERIKELLRNHVATSYLLK